MPAALRVSSRLRHPDGAKPRRKALAISPDRPRFLEVIDGDLFFTALAQLRLEECARVLEDGEQVAAAGGALAAAGLARHFHAGHARQFFHRLDKFQVAVLHQEADGAAVGTAAEAVKELLVAADREGRGLFAVKRAQALEILAGLAQRHVTLDQLDDVDAGQQVGDELFGNTASHGIRRRWLGKGDCMQRRERPVAAPAQG
jgi:hypothetical protein